jgi:chitin synthase
MYMYYLLGHRLMEVPIDVSRKEVRARNTFILALDGDIDFKPQAVLLLLDLMKKDKKLGAACGRIHPTGNGKLESLIAILWHLCATATCLQRAV